jgi:hypothetical protein
VVQWSVRTPLCLRESRKMRTQGNRIGKALYISKYTVCNLLASPWAQDILINERMMPMLFSMRLP